jgi:hypothetical protein
MTHDEMIEVIQAHKDGKAIQYKRLCAVTAWVSMGLREPSWDFCRNEYQVNTEELTND